jgi:hypothetical protein
MHSPVTGFNMHILGLYQAVESVSRRQIKAVVCFDLIQIPKN